MAHLAFLDHSAEQSEKCRTDNEVQSIVILSIAFRNNYVTVHKKRAGRYLPALLMIFTFHSKYRTV